MRELLKREAYLVLKAVLPQRVALSRMSHHGSFKDFCELPAPVRKVLLEYLPPDEDGVTADIVCFEVYEYTVPEHLLVIAISETEDVQFIESVGQYFKNAFAPCNPVDGMLIAKAERQVRKSWTIRDLHPDERKLTYLGWVLLGLGALDWGMLYLFGAGWIETLMHSESIGYNLFYFGCAFVLLAGPLFGFVFGILLPFMGWATAAANKRTLAQNARVA